MADAKRILVVDDEPSYREIFSLKLKSLGYEVDTAADAKEGMAKMHSFKPDLVLMDVQMPGQTGLEAFMGIKDDPELKNIKVVFLTNLGESVPNGQSTDDNISKEIGAAGYIKKSADLNEVMEKIKTYL